MPLHGSLLLVSASLRMEFGLPGTAFPGSRIFALTGLRLGFLLALVPPLHSSFQRLERWSLMPGAFGRLSGLRIGCKREMRRAPLAPSFRWPETAEVFIFTHCSQLRKSVGYSHVYLAEDLRTLGYGPLK